MRTSASSETSTSSFAPPREMARQARTKEHRLRLDVLHEAVHSGCLDRDQRPSAYFFDLDAIELNARDLKLSSFPHTALHTFAVKANPLIEILKLVRKTGLGAEAASLGELEIALEAGFPPKAIVYDSPTKTRHEIRRALDVGVLLNADNLAEVEVIARELEDRPTCSPSVGLRVNPQSGGGTISALATASARSKFGVAVGPNMKAIYRCFSRHRSFLSRIHVHTGSQGVGIAELAESAASVVRLAREVNDAAGCAVVRSVDVGGGLSVDYSSDSPRAHFDEYSELLSELLGSDLGDLEFDLVTEFGRSLICKSGFAACYVEYAKTAGEPGARIVAQHLGADTLLRTCYLPDDFPLRVFCASSSGESLETGREEDCVETDIAGPLCFAGDLVARGRMLPASLEPGSIVIVPDVGAYTTSMFSRYNSRPFPACYGFRGSAVGGVELEVLRREEDPRDLVRFWSKEP